MADRGTNEALRKPRRTKGTPFFAQRNYYAAGVILFGGISWLIFEAWPEAKKLKKSQLDGKFDDHREIKSRFLEAELSRKPGYMQLVAGLKRREEEREDVLYEDETRPRPWYSRLFGQPDV